ncbi:hypothetical protein H6G08_09865 [Calothrix anomala FACHB-343]|uniref:Transposase n=1 Tax=Calothrix anomala FACHB-343 TaxID=2692894 RepID=A0ABR8ARV4_9CYAN|nr:hypothetical protein [Calothrix anomala FACHB-343]
MIVYYLNTAIVEVNTILHQSFAEVGCLMDNISPGLLSNLTAVAIAYNLSCYLKLVVWTFGN